MVARSLRSRRSSISPSKEEEVPKPISMSIRAKLAHRSTKTSAFPVVGTPTFNQGHTHDAPQYTRGINESEEMSRNCQQQLMAHDNFEISSKPFWSPLPAPSSARERSMSPLAERFLLKSGNNSDPFYHQRDEVTVGDNELFCERVPKPIYEAQRSPDTIDDEAAMNLHNRKRARTVVGPRPTRLSDEDDSNRVEIRTSKLTHATPLTVDHPRTCGLLFCAGQEKTSTDFEIKDSCFSSILKPVIDDFQDFGSIASLDQAVSQASTRKESTRKRSDSGYASLPKVLSQEPSTSIRFVSPDKGASSFTSTATNPTKFGLGLPSFSRLLTAKPLNIEAANAQHLRGNDTLKETQGGFVPCETTAPTCPPHALGHHLGTAPHCIPGQRTEHPQTPPLIEQEKQEITKATQIVTTANGILTVKWNRRADGSYEESGSSRIVSWSRPTPATANRTSSGTSSELWKGSPSYSGRAWKRSDDSWASDTTVDVGMDDGCDGDMGFEPALACLGRAKRHSLSVD